MHRNAGIVAGLTAGLLLVAAVGGGGSRAGAAPTVRMVAFADSGVVQNRAGERGVIYSTVVRAPGAARMQLVFGELSLGTGPRPTVLRVTAATGATWRTTSERPSTPWLPGDALRLELIADPAAAPSRVAVAHTRVQRRPLTPWPSVPGAVDPVPDPGAGEPDGGGGPSSGGGNNEYEQPVPGGGGTTRPPNEYGPNNPYVRPPNEHEVSGCAPGSAPWSIEPPRQPDPTRVINVRSPAQLAEISGANVHARIIGNLEADLVIDHTMTNWILDLTEGSLLTVRFAPGAKIVKIVGANGPQRDLEKVDFYPTIGALQEDLTFSNLKIFNDESSALLRLRGRRVLVEDCDLSAKDYAIWGHGPLEEALIRDSYMHDVTHIESCVRFYFFDRVKFENCTIEKIHTIPGLGTLKHTVRAYISNHIWFDRCTFIGGRILVGGPSGGTSPPGETYPVRGACFTDCTMNHWNISEPLIFDYTADAYLHRCNISSTTATKAIWRSPSTVWGLVVEECTFNGEPLSPALHFKP